MVLFRRKVTQDPVQHPGTHEAPPTEGQVVDRITLRQDSIFLAVTNLRGPYETLERLKATWTTIGVVSALLMTFSFPAVYQPPIDPDLADHPLGIVFQVCNSTSAVASAVCVILSTICLAMTDWMTSEDHIKDYIVLVSSYYEILVVLFICSLGLLYGAVISITWLNAASVVATVLTSIWGFSTLFLAILYANIFFRNFRLLQYHHNRVNKERAQSFVDQLKRSAVKKVPAQGPSEAQANVLRTALPGQQQTVNEVIEDPAAIAAPIAKEGCA